MNEQQKVFFDELSTNRAESAKALESFALRGVKNSVVEKYSDQAHFIYELLQNADDAQATYAKFILSSDKLVFIHNGKRTFSVSNPNSEEDDRENGNLGDINAISAVGASNKTDNASTIGKFGVGFKAVFQYTSTPHIYDPNFSFKIERFIVPILLEDDFPIRKSDETLFVFPFNHETRTSEEAYNDIKEKLTSLDYPLLFLTNLKEISFEIGSIFGLYGKNIEKSYRYDDLIVEKIKLLQNNNDAQDELTEYTLWLFSQKSSVGHKCSVGFFMDEKNKLIPNTHSAFCFFPTKETTNLNFIIHAPFLLTDSREGIKAGEQHNVDLIAFLAKLSANSLMCLKDIGEKENIKFIDDNIFDIVPYDESQFTKIESKKQISFKPFYNEIITLFQNEKIIPTSSGYADSENAYWAFVPEIASLFSHEQLSILIDNENAKWVFTSFGRQETLRKNKALTKFIDQITETYIEEDDLIENSFDYDGISAEFIQKQSLEWLYKFYKWINATDNRTEMIRLKPIFINQKNKAVPLYNQNGDANLFLPTEDSEEELTVSDTLLQDETTSKLLNKLGITEPSLKDEINLKILPLYEVSKDIDSMPHFKKFFKYYQNCTQQEANQLIRKIQKLHILHSKTANDNTVYRRIPSELYFPSDNLKKWFKPKPEIWFLCFNDYIDLVGKEFEVELKDFLTTLGVHIHPKFTKKITPGYTRKSEETLMDGLEEIIYHIVSSKDLEYSIWLWRELCEYISSGILNRNILNARISTRPDGRYNWKPIISPSQVSQLLRNEKWIVDTDEQFVSAKEINKLKLSGQYDMTSDDVAELLEILGIEDEIEHSKTDISTYADSLGFTEEEAKAILQKAHQEKLSQKTENEVSDMESQDDRTASPISKIAKELGKQAEKSANNKNNSDNATTHKTTAKSVADEDDYSKPPVDISKKIEDIRIKAEQDIQEIAVLEELKQKANDAEKYSYLWFKSLLELEALNSSGTNINSREISISFSKVEHEEGTSRTLVLKHPNKYIPQSMEDLSDIPLELYFNNQPTIRVAIEVVNVKSYTLRVKLRSNVEIEGVDLSQVTEAQISAKNPVFLIDELKKAFTKLGDDNEYDDDFNMQENLCDNIEFVFGPPGTGKTTHLANNVIMPLMKDAENLKVLVLTPTNKSADVLTNRIIESMGNDESYHNWLVRFGVTNDIKIEKKGVFRDKTFDIRKFNRNVTITTIARFPYDYFLPENSTRLHLNALKWDYIIIDEASMIPLINIIYPLYKKTPNKFIIAGDPFQIEPITSVDLWKDENIYTMVELNSFVNPTTVPHDYTVTTLTTQYRSIPEIGNIFSQFAYNGVLKHNRTAQSRRELNVGDDIKLESVNLIKFPVSKYESIFKPKRLQSKTPYQVYSALFGFEFIKYLSCLISKSNQNDTFRIGLIAPYRAQADLVNKLIASIPLPKNIDVQVGTIHGFQGDECDIIIALFNTPPSISTNKNMFLNKLNIVNVSISRARDYLFILMPNDETENIHNLTLVNKVEEIAKAQECWLEYESYEIEKLMFNSESYIEDNSFSTTHQLVNVYREPEKKYEIRTDDTAVDIQVHDIK